MKNDEFTADERVAAALRAGGVKHLYHFTALANVSSIKEDGGFCSAKRRHLLGRKVPVATTDGS